LSILNAFNRLSFRQVMWLIAAVCVAMLAFGYYLQHVVGLEPCPMCVVQRYAIIFIAIQAIFTPARGKYAMFLAGNILLILTACIGAFVAARQSWLQWYPPEVASCGRDIYGMIETFPLQKVLPMIFKGSGDCTKIDWTFLGGSIANWSFLCFCGFIVVIVWNVLRSKSSSIK
jgi:protein dithiol:quinone oxidoreductase